MRIKVLYVYYAGKHLLVDQSRGFIWFKTVSYGKLMLHLYKNDYIFVQNDDAMYALNAA